MENQFTAANFETEVLKAEQPVLVDFYADWCGPCKMMGPVVEQLAQELEGQVKVGKINIDDHPEVAEKYHVMTIPTFLFIKNGQVMDTVIGVTAKGELESKCKALL